MITVLCRVLARLFSSGCSSIFLLPVRCVFIRRCFYIGNENISRWICEERTHARSGRCSVAAFRDFGDLIKINLRHRSDSHGSFSLPPEDLTRFVKVVTTSLTRINIDSTHQLGLGWPCRDWDKDSSILEAKRDRNACVYASTLIIFKLKY